MAKISLLSYLQMGIPEIPTNRPRYPSQDTTKTQYSANDIQGTATWGGFNLNAILRRYGGVLENARLPFDAMPTSPRFPIPSEQSLKGLIWELVIPRVRRGLRAGFDRLIALNQVNGLTTVTFGVGDLSQAIGMFRPDTTYRTLDFPTGQGPNRAPGDIKPSWKWNTAIATHPNPAKRYVYGQALSQVNSYMKQHRSRYGYLLTDQELVVFRRMDSNGHLELARPIPVTLNGTAERPQLTVLLALWYLGMLAAQDEGPDRWEM